MCSRTEQQNKAYADLSTALDAVVRANVEAGERPPLDGYILTDYVVTVHYISYDDEGHSNTWTDVIDRDGDTPEYRIIGMLEYAKHIVLNAD